MATKVETIDLKGSKYAQVKERIKAFHTDNKNTRIRTKCEFKEGFALFEARVDIFTGDFTKTYTGHALGKTQGLKAFEKLETIAVGRALALAGYLGDGDIASYEEIGEYQRQLTEHDAPDVDRSQVDEAIKYINEAQKLDDLKEFYVSLPKEVKGHSEVIEAKNAQKEKLSAASKKTTAKKTAKKSSSQK